MKNANILKIVLIILTCVALIDCTLPHQVTAQELQDEMNLEQTRPLRECTTLCTNYNYTNPRVVNDYTSRDGHHWNCFCNKINGEPIQVS